MPILAAMAAMATRVAAMATRAAAEAETAERVPEKATRAAEVVREVMPQIAVARAAVGAAVAVEVAVATLEAVSALWSKSRRLDTTSFAGCYSPRATRSRPWLAGGRLLWSLLPPLPRIAHTAADRDYLAVAMAALALAR